MHFQQCSVCIVHISLFVHQDIMHYCHKHGEDLPYPIIDDSDRVLAKKLGMLDGDEKDDKGIPVTARAVSD